MAELPCIGLSWLLKATFWKGVVPSFFHYGVVTWQDVISVVPGHLVLHSSLFEADLKSPFICISTCKRHAKTMQNSLAHKQVDFFPMVSCFVFPFFSIFFCFACSRIFWCFVCVFVCLLVVWTFFLPVFWVHVQVRISLIMETGGAPWGPL